MSTTIKNPLEQRIIATYSSKDAVDQTKVVLTRKLGLDEESLTVIEPTGEAHGKKLKNENTAKNSLYLHIKYPLVGFIVGMIIAFSLVEFGPVLTRSNPMFTFIACISLGLFLGAFYAGLRTLKPEQDSINLEAVKAPRKNYWTLLVKMQNVNVSKEAIREEIRQTQCQSVS